MANFPIPPYGDDTHVEGDVTWKYDGEKWVKQSPTITTTRVELADPAHPAQVLGVPQAIPDVPDDTKSQYDVNRWFVSALTALDDKFEDGDIIAGIHVGENPPIEYVDGTLWFDSSEDALSLFIYYQPDGYADGAWIPAAPPVSAIEEINALLQGLGDDVDLLEERVLNINTLGEIPVDPAQDGYIWYNTTEGIERAYIYDIVDKDWKLLSPNSRISDGPPADPVNGDLWFESDTDLALFIYYQPDGYSPGSWIPAAPPSSVVDDALKVQEDLVVRVTAGETLQEQIQETVETALEKQKEIIDDVYGLTIKVDALEGTLIDGMWAYTSSATPGTGEFDIVESGSQNTTSWAADSIRIHITDQNSKTFTFDEVNLTDVIRIGSQDASVVYRIDTITAPSPDVASFEVTILNSTGVPTPGDSYDFEFLPSFDPSAYATTEYVDGLDEKNVKLDSGDNVTTNAFRLKSSTGKTLLSTSNGDDLGIYNLRDPGDPSHALNLGYADGRYVKPTDLDDLDDKYVLKSGDDITGVLNLTAKDQDNNDGVRFYMRDTDGNINVSMTPSGIVEIFNILRFKKSGTGDVLQVRDGPGGAVVSKLTADGNSEFKKITLTGGSSADTNERVLNVKSGIVGRLAYNSNTRLTWGSSQVWIGHNNDVGDSATTVTLNLQDNPITNVGSIVVNAKANSASSTKYFTIKGTLADGTDDSDSFFYAYHTTGDGSPDAVNYNGKINVDTNIVNKKYVDTAIAGVSVSGDYLPLAGGTMTGTFTGQLIKSVRTGSGYAIEIKPSDIDTTTALIRCSGSAEFRPETTASTTDTVFAVKPKGFNNNEKAFHVQNNGQVKAGHSTGAGFMATQGNDVLTKRYSDDKLTHGKFKITSSGGNYYIEPN
jgi:hypothetical protein